MNVRFMLRSPVCYALGIATVLAFAPGVRAQSDKAIEGPCGSLFGSKVCTSYQMRDGKITELSLRVPVAMVENAPANVAMVWPPKPDLNIRFAPAVQKQTGFTFASIWWEAHGHPPAAFMVPHFDLHFYFAPEQKVETIDCKDTVKPQALPAGYVLRDLTDPHIGTMVGACIPNMGMHALPTADLTLKTGWKASMMVGYYGAKPIFFEPMVSNALLLQKRSFTLPVAQDIAPAAHVRYPKTFRAVYHPESKVYDFTFFY